MTTLCRPSGKKGVDMRIGLDIASLTLKGQADTIILVSGDADFVPAAKLARREGVRFVLDPLWQEIPADLNEHVDGLTSGFPRPRGSVAVTGPDERPLASASGNSRVLGIDGPSR